MKRFDFYLQAVTLMLYVVLCPLLFGQLHGGSGDQRLIWMWVVLVTGISSLISLALFILLNFFVDFEKTYKYKVLLPLALSSFLMYNISSHLPVEKEIKFILANTLLLLVLYFANGIVISRKIRSGQTS